MIDKNVAAEPVAPPTPTAPSPAAPAAEIQAQIEPREPSKAYVNPRVKQRWISTPNRRSPHINGIVIRHVPYIGIGRFDSDCRLATLVFGGDCLLRGGVESAPLLGLRAHALDGLHHVRLLRKKSVSELRGPGEILR